MVSRLDDPNWVVRSCAMDTLCSLEPATIAQHADALVARLEDHRVCGHAIAALSKLEPATLAKYAVAVVTWGLRAPRWRCQALKTLGKLEPETLARHTDAVVEMLEDPSLDVCCWALIALKKLPPATLAQHADAIVASLSDSNVKLRTYDVRMTALDTLGRLEPATLAQYAGAIVARLIDSSEDVPKKALETLGKVEPARLAPHTGAVIDTWLELHPNDENFVGSSLARRQREQRAEACASALALIRALPCYRDIDFVSGDMRSADVRSRLRSRLLARLRWYMYGLRLRVQRIALC